MILDLYLKSVYCKFFFVNKMKQSKYYYPYGNKIPLSYLDIKHQTNSPSLTRVYPTHKRVYMTRNPMSGIYRQYPTKADQEQASSQPSEQEPTKNNKKDFYCNNGLSTGDYPIPFSQSCNAISDGINTCYPYASIVSLISMMIQFKNSGISYDVLGNMFDQALTLYNNNTGRPPYFITDYTYAVLRSILVGSYSDQYINSSYPPNYYDRVIASLADLQKRQNDYDYRFQLNGQLICYLVNSLKGIPPNGLSTIYQPNLNPINVEQLSYNSLF